MKNEQRMQFLSRAVPSQRGKYACTVPACKTKAKKDGFCPTHDIPLRLEHSQY